MSPLDIIRPKLPNAQPNGRGYKACCPAHDDQNPSLGFGERSDGSVWITCHAGCSLESILQKLGLERSELSGPEHAGPTSGKQGRTCSRRDILETYDYRDENSELLFQVCRMEPKDFRQRRPDGNGKWIWNLKGVRRVLYGLPVLAEADLSETVFIPEGEKDVNRLRSLSLIATCNPGGAGKWRATYNEYLRDRHVAILPDNDAKGREHAEQVARSLNGIAASVRIVPLPDLPEKGDVSDWIKSGGTDSQLREMVATSPIWQPEEKTEADAPPAKEDAPRKVSQASRLVMLATEAGIELFHTPGTDSEAYGTIRIGLHRETHRVGTKAFRMWLQRLYWMAMERAPGSQAIQDATGVLSGKARFEGQQIPAAVRMAECDGEIYVDLANSDWEAVRIHAGGWEIVKDPPVRFIRPRGMLGLPKPVSGGSPDELRRFLNLDDDEAWVLILAWLVATFRPAGPFPILVLNGEQGSAKSTACRILRSLVDPNAAPLRAEPREPRDLMIAATNSWCIGFDNLSSIPNWLSDALCRLSTGGGFSARELYTDGEEKLFDAKRPIIANGITELTTRPDLLDRMITVTLPPIPERARRPETKLWSDFDEVRPLIVGALFEAVATALRGLSSVHLERLPRMADFAVWVTAAEPAFVCQSGTFERAYAKSRDTLNESALEGCPIAGPLQSLLEARNGWEGTATELLDELCKLVEERQLRERDWPKKPHLLSGVLRRIAPNLRKLGWDCSFDDREKKSRRKIIRIRATGAESVPSVQSERSSNAEPSGAFRKRSSADGERSRGPQTACELLGENGITNAGNAGNALGTESSETDWEEDDGICAPTAIPVHCDVHREQAFWQSKSGPHLICAICHPPAHPDVVERQIAPGPY